MSLSRHFNQDVHERIQRDDMMQAAVIVATYVYTAAVRDSMLPRKPRPRQAPPKPEATNQ